MNAIADLLPPRTRLKRGFWVSVALWSFFLVATAYTSAATLLDRVGSTDVMKAASGGAWSGRVAWEIATFLLVQVALHFAFAVLTCLLALATAAVSAEFRGKYGRMVVGWFCVLAAAAISFNAYWYPRTLIGAYYNGLMHVELGPWHLGPVIYWGALILSVTVSLAAAVTCFRAASAAGRRRTVWAGSALAGVVVAAVGLPNLTAGHAAAANAARPNVIFLGIDSLRLEQLQRFGGRGVTPNLDRFLARAEIFSDTTTPAARTFSSWVAIMTGRSPTQTNARFNLAERSSVLANPTIADVLRKAGYRTVYSTDEVRFANIDESYGFDQVVTPRIGASDFLVGTYNELPLAALTINTRLGKWLFPFSYANRGVATMFQPETYIDRLRRDVDFDQPTFFIAHLTAAHWPYYTSEVPFKVPPATDDNPRPTYRIGLQTADRMFGELISVLESKGALDNAIVIVLSDHGEALMLPSDSFFDSTFHVEGLRAPLQMRDYGHGQSVMSQSQYHVLLSFRTFGPARRFVESGRTHGFPSTVEDIAPTVLDYLGIRGDPLAASGRSLLPILEGRETLDPSRPERIRFTETDLAVLPAPGGGVDEVATAKQNSKFFEVDQTTGRLHLRTEYAPLARAFKERAAFTEQNLLAAIPAGPYAHQYVYLDFSRKHGRLLLARPGDTDPEAQRMWDALQEHFKGELRKPVAASMEDWPRIGAEWEGFATAHNNAPPPDDHVSGGR